MDSIWSVFKIKDRKVECEDSLDCYQRVPGSCCFLFCENIPIKSMHQLSGPSSLQNEREEKQELGFVNFSDGQLLSGKQETLCHSPARWKESLRHNKPSQ